MNLPIILLIFLLLAIGLRTVIRIHVPIWLMMATCALIVIVSGNISPEQSWHAISWPIIFYLFCLFYLGSACERSGLLIDTAQVIIAHCHTRNRLIYFLCFFFGLLSALLMNDTVAIVFTPLVLLLAKQLKIDAKLMLLLLCFSITVGSVMSPVGNPQNLLIADALLHGNSLGVFLHYLFVPTMVSLFLCAWIMARFAANHMPDTINLSFNKTDHSHDAVLKKRVKLSLLLLVIMLLLKLILNTFVVSWQIQYSEIAFFVLLPLLFYSSPNKLLQNLDWGTLIFFIAMFIFMKSIWLTGTIQSLICETGVNMHSVSAIYAIGIVVSQLLSNVPLVALYLPLLHGAPLQSYMALAASSTLAGNFFILGAASNVIVIEQAKKKAGVSVSLWQFCRLAIPIALLSLAIYALYFYWNVGVM